LLRVVAEHGMREDRACLAARLLQRDDVGGADLELTIAPVVIGVALVEGLAAGGTHLEHQAALVRVEEIDLGTAGRTSGADDELSRELDFWHLYATDISSSDAAARAMRLRRTSRGGRSQERRLSG